ncbi:2'-5' RNA ligase family protein [Streptomyces sp. NBC_01597]|uniref:2'-5' RNA ligase family protein n=1 Tax=Streptomyces sp. NBC_01597 TaxID=2975891 RepID=UPI00386A44F8
MLLTASPTAFPAAPPPSTDDPHIIAAHDWAAFGSVDQMNNHWDRPGWHSSTRAYYWMLTFADAAALTEQMRSCQQRLASLEFDLIDEDGLHLTLGRIGLANEVSGAQLHTLRTRASARLPDAFTISAVPMAASRGAIRYSVAPWTPLINLHSDLSLASDQCGLPLKKPTSVLRPHIGIAYCNRTQNAHEVREAIRPLRDLPAITVQIRQVELVELRREDRAYRWRTLAVLPLR